MFAIDNHLSENDVVSSIKAMLSMAFSVFASIGAAALSMYGVSGCLYATLLISMKGTFTELWDELFGVKPPFTVYIGSADAIALGELINGIKTLILLPKKLKWWEREEFHAALGLLVVLLTMWSLHSVLRRRR